jgi:sortase A
MQVKKKTNLKKKLPAVFLVCVFLVGAGLIAYPTVADWWNSFHATQAIASYQESVASVSDDEYSLMLQQAQAYNEKLAQEPMHFSLSETETEEYNSVLDITGTGIMGWISIPRLDVKLPIYHGTDASVLQAGAGHLAGSSLPVGGIGTHAVISAHSGLTSARMFTGLDEMEPGDLVYLNVLGEQLTYQVSGSITVLPEEMDTLKIDPDKDQITLVTCTPYGVNTHRLLVQAQRIENSADAEISGDAVQISTDYTAIAIALVLVFAFTVYTLVKARKSKKY